MSAAATDMRPRYSIGPLVTLAIDAAELKDWAVAAAPGARLIYASGRIPPRGKAVWAMAGGLAELGLVTLMAHRRSDGATDWIAERLPSPIAVSDDGPEARVFAELARCAAAGLTMPTDAQLARRCGLADADRASYVLRRLKDVRAGERRIQGVNWGPGEHREAILLATGARTARGRL